MLKYNLKKLIIFTIIFIISLLIIVSCQNNMPVSGDSGDAGSDSGYEELCDGKSWSEAVPTGDMWEERALHTSLVYDGKMWVMGGVKIDTNTTVFNDVWSSEDGVTWECQTESAEWSARAGLVSVVYDGKMWIMGGYYNTEYESDVWSSEDGMTWTLEMESHSPSTSTEWGDRKGHTANVFASELWVIGGADYNGLNEVWHSSTGDYWIQIDNDSIDWLPRSHHTTTVFDGKLWLIGGQIDYTSNKRNDVWTSENGASWSEETALTLPNEGVYGHTALSYGDKLWIMGGFSNAGKIWETDGSYAWAEVTPNEGEMWSDRSYHTCLNFKGKMWVLGGSHGTLSQGLIYRNDVWYTN